MALYSYGLPSYGLHSYGLHSYGLAKSMYRYRVRDEPTNAIFDPARHRRTRADATGTTSHDSAPRPPSRSRRRAPITWDRWHGRSLKRVNERVAVGAPAQKSAGTRQSIWRHHGATSLSPLSFSSARGAYIAAQRQRRSKSAGPHSPPSTLTPCVAASRAAKCASMWRAGSKYSAWACHTADALGGINLTF